MKETIVSFYDVHNMEIRDEILAKNVIFYSQIYYCYSIKLQKKIIFIMNVKKTYMMNLKSFWN